MSPEWVRRQILAGRLPARVYRTGRRSTYRLRWPDVEAFVRRYASELAGDGTRYDPSEFDDDRLP